MDGGWSTILNRHGARGRWSMVANPIFFLKGQSRWGRQDHSLCALVSASADGVAELPKLRSDQGTEGRDQYGETLVFPLRPLPQPAFTSFGPYCGIPGCILAGNECTKRPLKKMRKQVEKVRSRA